MKDTTYNGWTNYATWRVNLEMFDGYDLDGQKFDGVSGLADHLKEMAEDAVSNYGEIKDGLALDYAYAFLSDVNFYEIAQHIAEEQYPDDEAFKEIDESTV